MSFHPLTENLQPAEGKKKRKRRMTGGGQGESEGETLTREWEEKQKKRTGTISFCCRSESNFFILEQFSGGGVFCLFSKINSCSCGLGRFILWISSHHSKCFSVLCRHHLHVLSVRDLHQGSYEKHAVYTVCIVFSIISAKKHQKKKIYSTKK